MLCVPFDPSVSAFLTPPLPLQKKQKAKVTLLTLHIEFMQLVEIREARAHRGRHGHWRCLRHLDKSLGADAWTPAPQQARVRVVTDWVGSGKRRDWRRHTILEGATQNQVTGDPLSCATGVEKEITPLQFGLSERNFTLPSASKCARASDDD